MNGRDRETTRGDLQNAGAVLIRRDPRHRTGRGVPAEPLEVLRVREELLDKGLCLETLRHPRRLVPLLEVARERRGIGCAAGHRGGAHHP